MGKEGKATPGMPRFGVCMFDPGLDDSYIHHFAVTPEMSFRPIPTPTEARQGATRKPNPPACVPSMGQDPPELH